MIKRVFDRVGFGPSYDVVFSPTDKQIFLFIAYLYYYIVLIRGATAVILYNTYIYIAMRWNLGPILLPPARDIIGTSLL